MTFPASSSAIARWLEIWPGKRGFQKVARDSGDACWRIDRASNGLQLGLAKSRRLRELCRGHSIRTHVLKSLWPFRIAYLNSFSEATACDLVPLRDLRRNGRLATCRPVDR